MAGLPFQQKLLRLSTLAGAVVLFAVCCCSPAFAQPTSALRAALQSEGQGFDAANADHGFTITDMSVVGVVDSVDAGYARLTFNISAKIFSPTKQTIPLRLANLVLSSDPQYSSPDVGQVLTFSSKQGGFLWQIEDSAASLREPTTHVLELQLSARISKTGPRNEIQLQLPTAMKSALKLQVPHTEVNARAPRRDDLGIEKTEDGTTITIDNPERDFSLRWWQEDRGELAERIVVQENLMTWLDPATGVIRHEAQYEVLGDFAPGELLEIDMPEGFVLESASPEAITTQPPTLSEVARDESAGVPESGEQTIHVAIPREGNFRLVFERPTAAFGDLQLERPALTARVRSSGRWSLACPQGWQLAAERLPESMSRIAAEDIGSVPAAIPAEGSIRLALRYWGAAEPLDVSLFRPRTLTTVQPTHEVYADSNVLRLQSTFDANIVSGQVHSFRIDLHDWILEDVRCEEASLVESTAVDDFGMLRVNLNRPVSGRVRLAIVASQDVRGDDAFDFELPGLADSAMRNGAFELTMADSLQCVPHAERMEGLSRDNRAASEGLAYQLSGERWRFVGLARPQPQFTLRSDTEVNVTPQSMAVSQLLSTTAIAREFRLLRITVPRKMWDMRHDIGLQFLWNERPCEFVQESAGGLSDPKFPDPEYVVLAMLTDSSSGQPGASERGRARQVLSMSYEMANGDTPEQAEMYGIGLAIPANAPFSEHAVEVLHSLPFQLRIANDSTAWAETVGREGEAFRNTYYTATAATELKLARDSIGHSTSGRIVIDQLVIQSWLGTKYREDRLMLTWRPASAADELRLRLPPNSGEQCVVRDAGGRPLWLQRESNQDEVVLNAGQLWGTSQRTLQPISLELVYRVQTENGGMMNLPAPQFVGDVRVLHSFWHVSMPAGQHLLWAGDEMQDDNTWNWRNGWTRKPNASLRALEEIVGVAPSPALSPATNQYLFSSVGLPESLSVTAADRSLIVGISSLLTLLLGVSVLSFPSLRRPGIVFVAIVLFAALAFLFQSVAVLFLYASALGVVLVLLAVLLRRMFSNDLKIRTRDSSSGEITESQVLREHESQAAATEIRLPATPTSQP